MRVTGLAFTITVLFAAVPYALAKHGEGELGDDNGGSSSTTPTQTSSSASPSSSSSPFQFLPPSNATTCQNILLKWQSSNVTVPITLTITNQRGTGVSTSSSGSGNAALVSQTLSTNVSASAGQFMWEPVDVPPGSYVALAFDTSQTAGIFAQSSPFFVQTGQNSSCLAAAAASSTAGVSASSGSATPTSGSDAASGSSGGAQPKKLSAGVLGGVVAGVVVGVLLLILAATFPHYWKDALVRRRVNRHPGGPYHLF